MYSINSINSDLTTSTVSINYNSPNFSIIILNYNGIHHLDACLSSIYSNNYPHSDYEVIFVDNASTDGSIDYIKLNYPQVRILSLDKNYGFTGGNNRGAQIAKGKFIIFLNNDVIIEKNCLLELEKIVHSHSNIAIVGSKIMNMTQKDVAQYYGAYLNLLGGSVFFSKYDQHSKKDFYFTGSICGAAFLINRCVFTELGGFDDAFFMYAEEGDLCCRAWINGYKVAYAPNSIVYHLSGGTSCKKNRIAIKHRNIMCMRLSSPLSLYYGNRNSIMMLIKNYQFFNVIKGLLASYLMFLPQLFYLLLNKQGNYLLLFKSAIWPVTNFKYIWKKRLVIQKNRKVKDSWLTNNGFLLSMSDTIRLLSVRLTQTE